MPNQLADGTVVALPNPFSIGADQVIGWIVKGVTKAINTFFSGLVKDALNPLLTLLGRTLLSTPDLSSLPRVGQLWENNRQIAVACYALLIVVAGVVVMAYETVQTRHSIKEIAPRVVVGFLAANLSLILASQAVSFANALSLGVLSGGVNAQGTAGVLTVLIMGAIDNGGIFLIFIGIALAVMLIALLVGYVIRVALTVILVAGAPLALMCHALPQTDGIARWWWRAFAGVLAIQLAQSLTLVTALNVFLSKGGFTLFGPTADGLVNLIVTLALLYILWKIPFWIWHQVHTTSGRRSMIGGVIKGIIAYKTLGLLGIRAGGRGGPTPHGSASHGPAPRGPGGGSTGPGGGPRTSGPRPGGPRPAGGAQPGPRRPARTPTPQPRTSQPRTTRTQTAPSRTAQSRTTQSRAVSVGRPVGAAQASERRAGRVVSSWPGAALRTTRPTPAPATPHPAPAAVSAGSRR